jgi:hypothetical protein
MKGNTNEEKAMNDDLKRRWEDLNRQAYGQSTPLLEKVFDLARDLMTRLEDAEKALGLCAVSPWKDTARVAQKALDCYGIEYGGRGKYTVQECEIEGSLQVEVVGARG